jgi:hypothetical protein
MRRDSNAHLLVRLRLYLGIETFHDRERQQELQAYELHQDAPNMMVLRWCRALAPGHHFPYGKIVAIQMKQNKKFREGLFICGLIDFDESYKM